VTTPDILTFTCSICGEPSRDICVACTKDACHNHRCERCKRCSDCCGCDVPLSAAEAEAEIHHYAPPEPEMPEPEMVVPEPMFSPTHPPTPAPEPLPETPESIAESLPELFRPETKPTNE
jgi:hypothetical protein